LKSTNKPRREEMASVALTILEINISYKAKKRKKGGRGGISV